MTKTLLSILLLLSSVFGKPTDGQIQGRLNHVNGDAVECVMHRFYADTGWTHIEGEVGKNGIDGLFYKKKNGTIREVLVAESKWNKSRLGKSGKNKLLKQMSKKWILSAISRLQKYQPLPEYKTIKKMVLNNQYRARLFRMFPRSNNKVQIQIYKIKNKGDKDFDLKIDSKLSVIKMGKPKNSFETRVLNTYNQCRTVSLHKHFPLLHKDEILVLMKDNYLQKNDLKVLFRD